MKVLVLHSLPPAILVGRSPLEFDLEKAANDIAGALPGSTSVGVRGDIDEIINLLKGYRPDVVFNACEAPLGRPDRESHFAALLEWAGVPFTGCGSETLALCRRKDRTRAVLASAGVPVPRANVFPCIVKPIDEDGSVGIYFDSVCENEEARSRAVLRLNGAALVEEFVPGREFAVALWGCREPDYFSFTETRFQNTARLLTYAAKWNEGSEEFANTPYAYSTQIEAGTRDAIATAAAGAWKAVDARGYLTVDLRLDAAGNPFVLDVNPNPDLGPGVGIARAAKEIGWTWRRFVRQQVEWARS
jgi:D-alanine-D-alanine ligase